MQVQEKQKRKAPLPGTVTGRADGAFLQNMDGFLNHLAQSEFNLAAKDPRAPTKVDVRNADYRQAKNDPVTHAVSRLETVCANLLSIDAELQSAMRSGNYFLRVGRPTFQPTSHSKFRLFPLSGVSGP